MGVDYFACAHCEKITHDHMPDNLHCRECHKVFCEDCRDQGINIKNNECDFCSHCDPDSIHPSENGFIHYLLEKKFKDFSHIKSSPLWKEYEAYLQSNLDQKKAREKEHKLESEEETSEKETSEEENYPQKKVIKI